MKRGGLVVGNAGRVQDLVQLLEGMDVADVPLVVLEDGRYAIDAKAELGEAKVKLEQVTKNQTAAAEDQKQVEAALAKAKKAYKALVKDELDELNKEAKELSAKAAKAPAATKAATSKTLQQVSTKQKDVAKELGELDSATLETLDSVKAKLDKA